MRQHVNKDSRKLRWYRTNSWAIYLSYFRIASRNLAKNRGISTINIVCLAVGMSVGLLALGAYLDRKEVDNFHANRRDIYRIITNTDDRKTKETYASSPAPLAERVKTEITGIAQVTEVSKDITAEVVVAPNFSVPLTAYYADENFLNVFSFPLTEGTGEQALRRPFTVVITETAAAKIFRDISPVGKIVELNGLGQFEITGVMKDYPRSHFNFEILVSYSTKTELNKSAGMPSGKNEWSDLDDHYTYVELETRALPSAVENSIANLAIPEQESIQTKTTYELQRLGDIPGAELLNGIGLLWGDSGYTVLFMLTALVLLPACFNYSNITIARSLKRAKEIGIRKVSGGQSAHIFWQMIMETVIISFLSLAASLIIFILVRKDFMALVSNGQRKFDLELTPVILLVFFAFALLTGVFAGALPAAYFSKMNTIETLRNSFQNGKLSKISIRKGLIVFQFVLTLTFILSVVMIGKQYRYALSFDPGSQQRNLLQVPLKGADVTLVESEFSRVPGVGSVSMSSSANGKWSQESVWIENEDDSTMVFQMFANADHIDVLNFEIIAGSNLPSESSIQDRFVIVNETLTKKFRLGSPRDALGQTITIEGSEWQIIGVVKDFNFMPLQREMYSFLFRSDPARYRYATVSLDGENTDETILELKDAWQTISSQPFESISMDVQMEESFRPYRSLILVSSFLGVISIVISCLGLLAVVISIVESRTREIGMRKMFGATLPDVTRTIAGNLIVLILIAVMIATPLTYFFFDQVFLKQFYYHATIGLTEIAVSLIFLMVLVAIVIGTQVLKISSINPVETLKYE
jgi:putative ABC transport system permease protein